MRIAGVNISSDTLTSVSGSVVTAQGISQVAVNNNMLATISTSQTTNTAANDHVKFDTVNSVLGTAISLDISTAYTTTAAAASIGRFTLRSGFTYKLTASINLQSTTNQANLQWYDATNSAFITGNQIFSTTPAAGGQVAPQSQATSIITPTTNILVEVRVVTETGALTAVAVSPDCSAYIETINAYVPVVNTINSAIRRNNGTTQGATNTTVVIYSTAVSSTGADITYVNSAANGDSFLINTTGVYSITAIAQPSGNNANLELRAGTLDNAGSDAKTLALIQTDQTNDNRCISWTGPLTAGQSAWVRSSTSLTGGQFLNQVTIVRVA